MLSRADLHFFFSIDTQIELTELVNNRYKCIPNQLALGYVLQIPSLTLSVDALLLGEVHEEMGGRDPHSVLLNENTAPILLWLCMYVGLLI